MQRRTRDRLPAARRLLPALRDPLPAASCLLPAVIVLFLSLSLSAQQQQSDYVIGPQDVLSVTVWDQPDLNNKFTVETDGSFTFPMIGRVQAGGLTLRQVEAELRKRLSDGYFKNPQLTVAVDTYRSQRVFIIGEVRTPGTYVLSGNMSLIEALSRAGSTTAAASHEAVIVRAAEGKKGDGPTLPDQAEAGEVVRVQLRDLQSGNLSDNVPLHDGDTIVIPRAEMVYVFGQVKNPGAYPLQAQETTVMQALALAGGVTDRGSTGRVKISRLVDGAKKELKVKLSDLVLPGDTIIVPERFF